MRQLYIALFAFCGVRSGKISFANFIKTNEHKLKAINLEICLAAAKTQMATA